MNGVIAAGEAVLKAILFIVLITVSGGLAVFCAELALSYVSETTGQR